MMRAAVFQNISAKKCSGLSYDWMMLGHKMSKGLGLDSLWPEILPKFTEGV
jgi:hypothetical protein